MASTTRQFNSHMSKDTSTSSQESIQPIGGGFGTVAAPSRPDLVVFGDGGVSLLTPGHIVMSAGTTAGLTATHDINMCAERNIAIAVEKDLGFFTVAKATNPDKPNQETGMQFHAASGSLLVQAKKSTLGLIADTAINVSSTTGAITIGSPKEVLLAAGGSSIRINSQGITLTTNGSVSFKAAQKELAGPASASASLTLPPASKIDDCGRAVQDAASSQAGAVALQ